MKNVTEAMELIKKLRLLENEVYEMIMNEVDTIAPLKDVTEISSHICTVNISTIMENRFIMSPEYYIQDVQREEIKKHLSRCGKSVEKMTERIKEMIDEKCINSGRKNDKKIMLNSSSLKVLSEIYEKLMD